MGEADSISAVGVGVANPDDTLLRRALLDRPKVATITDRAVSLRQFRQTTQTFVLVMAGILSAFSIVIAIGVVYNHTRIALQERAWELASLRVLGFTRAEVARLLLSELLWQLLIAVPAGLWLGYWLVRGLIALHDTEMFQIPAVVQPTQLRVGWDRGSSERGRQRVPCAPADRSSRSRRCAQGAGVGPCNG